MVSIRRRRDDTTPEPQDGAQGRPERSVPPATEQTQPIERPGARPAEQPVQQPVQQPAQQPAQQPVEPTARYESSTRQPPPAAAPAREAREVREVHEVRQESVLSDPAYQRFGGANLGAAFFGWMVAVGTTVLLSSLIGALLLVLGTGLPSGDLAAELELTTASIVSAAVLLAVLLVAYYSGGYVAGRMSRFDGGRQGFAVWLLALLVTVVGGVGSWVAGDQLDVLAGVDLPAVGLSGQELTVAGIVALVVVLGGTLLAAVSGGKVGRRYHRKVDRAL